MISIRKTTDELERLEEFGQSAVACYSEAIGLTGRYAIEFNSEQVGRFREQLHALSRQLRSAGSPQQLKSVQVSFDAEVKEFQHRVHDHLDQLRREVAAAEGAVAAFSTSFNQSGSELEAGVKRNLDQLNKVAASDDIHQIGFGLWLKEKMDALKVECEIVGGWPMNPESTGRDKTDLEFVLRHFGMKP